MSAFCFSPEIIDFQLLQLWLRGLTVAQATSARDDADPVLRDVLEMDTADNFRLFEELQPSLEEPRSTMCLLDIAPQVRLALAESFYSFDDVVLREFLGRKFTSRARKDLDDVSEVTGVPRRSCLRQFDNLKRIYDAGDEIGFQIQYPSQARVADVLREIFLIPRALMTRYEAILFLMHHRFNISSTTKKKVPVGSLRDFEFCAMTILSTWCVKAPFQPIMISSRNRSLEGFDSPPVPSSMTAVNTYTGAYPSASTPLPIASQYSGGISDLFCPFDLDSSLFARFRDLKARALQYQGEVWAATAASFEVANERRRIEIRFKPWFRALVQCATGRDLKDFFEDLTAAVVEPLLEMRTDVEKFFEILDRGMVQTFTYADLQTWHLLIAVIKPCVIRFCAVHPMRASLDVEPEEES